MSIEEMREKVRAVYALAEEWRRDVTPLTIWRERDHLLAALDELERLRKGVSAIFEDEGEGR